MTALPEGVISAVQTVLSAIPPPVLSANPEATPLATVISPTAKPVTASEKVKVAVKAPVLVVGTPLMATVRRSVVHGVAIMVGSRWRGVGQPIARRVLDVLGAGKAQRHIGVETGQIPARGFDIIGRPRRTRNRRHGQDSRCTQ